MILVVFFALLGAFLAFNSRNRLLAAIVTGVLGASSHVILQALAETAMFFAARPSQVKLFFDLVGANGNPVHTACAGAISALVAGLLAVLAEPREQPGLYPPETAKHRRRRRVRPSADFHRPIALGRGRAVSDD